ncbi:MAG: hypothetical protein ACRYF2_04890 [Janthinobacterium lividum]
MSYRPNLPAPIATTTQPGIIKPDGTTITVAADATASVVGTAITALTDISSTTLGGPALSDIDTLNRAGTDYKVTLSARSALFRKNPAGSRTITLLSGSTSAVLTSTDNDKQVVVTGAAGTLSADGTITDGFRCLVINKTGSALTLSGIAGLGGALSLAASSSSQVYMAASNIEATTSWIPSFSTALSAVNIWVRPIKTLPRLQPARNIGNWPSMTRQCRRQHDSQPGSPAHIFLNLDDKK